MLVYKLDPCLPACGWCTLLASTAHWGVVSFDGQQKRPHSAHSAFRTVSVCSAVCNSVPYSLEILKTGESLGVKQIAAKDHYTFGRSPTADFTLEHPTSSRLHAVLQYNGSTKEAFVYDCGSTHGTFINKNKLKPGVHVPVRYAGRTQTS